MLPLPFPLFCKFPLVAVLLELLYEFPFVFVCKAEKVLACLDRAAAMW